MLHISDGTVLTEITHWFPIVTRCPVNGLPDPLFVSITFGDFAELYAVRKALRRAFSGKKMFMEDVAKEVARMYPDAKMVRVRLWFNRHIVTIYP